MIANTSLFLIWNNRNLITFNINSITNYSMSRFMVCSMLFFIKLIIHFNAPISCLSKTLGLIKTVSDYLFSINLINLTKLVMLLKIKIASL